MPTRSSLRPLVRFYHARVGTQLLCFLLATPHSIRVAHVQMRRIQRRAPTPSSHGHFIFLLTFAEQYAVHSLHKGILPPKCTMIRLFPAKRARFIFQNRHFDHSRNVSLLDFSPKKFTIHFSGPKTPKNGVRFVLGHFMCGRNLMWIRERHR